MVDDVRNISIVDYLTKLGIETRKEGPRYFCSSPFSSDRNWSFCVYPTNTYFDWSTGHGGSIIDLHGRMRGISGQEAYKELISGIKYETYKADFKEDERPQPQQIKSFDYKKYLNTRPEECAQIKAYAASRGITEGFECGVFFSRKRDSESERLSNKKLGGIWVRNPSMMFVHVDKDLKPCGAKFRKIKNEEPRFSARGTLGLYIQANLDTFLALQSPVLYVVEGEANANSLINILKSLNKVGIALSAGGVSSTSRHIPEVYQHFPRKLIIDFDGDETLYQERLKLYEDLKAEPIKLILPKGEDINSLYVKNKMYLIEHLL